MIVRIDYPEPSVRLDLWGGVSGAFAGLDLFNRIIDQRWQNQIISTPTDIDRYQYGYDQNSNRLYKANLVGTPIVTGDLDEYYTYDPLNRLTEMQRGVLNGTKTGITGTPSVEQDWTLDPTGNWSGFVTKASGTADLNQNRTNNKVNEITNITESTGPTWVVPAYDAAGNTTTMPQVADPTQSFTAVYDAWNRMVSISDTSGTVATYSYDGRNRRIIKTTTSETRHFYFTNAWQDIEERIGSSTSMDKQYVWGIRYIYELVCRDDATPQRFYACQDAIFSLTAIINASGDVQERYLFDPYGNRTIMDASWTIVTSSAFGWLTGHQGLHIDEETRLINNRARQRHTLLGSFMSRDPVGYTSTANMYLYVDNSPTVNRDPSGLRCYYTMKHGRPSPRDTSAIIVDDNTYIDKECCCTLSIVVDIQRLNPVALFSGNTSPGHDAIAIDDTLYDYGALGRNPFGSPGTPWWMANYPSLSKLLPKISSAASGDIVVIFKLSVQKDQCEAARQYWKYGSPRNPLILV